MTFSMSPERNKYFENNGALRAHRLSGLQLPTADGSWMLSGERPACVAGFMGPTLYFADTFGLANQNKCA